MTITLNRSEHYRAVIGICAWFIGFIILLFVWFGMGFIDSKYCCPPGYLEVSQILCRLGNDTIPMQQNAPCPYTMLRHIGALTAAIQLVPVSFFLYDMVHTKNAVPPRAEPRNDHVESV